MNIPAFDQIRDLMVHRRTVKFAAMIGQPIADADIEALLELANWAPNHGNTEPWRFWVYTGEGLVRFCADHAQMYWEHTPEESRVQATYERLGEFHKQATCLIIAAMRRGENAKIPVMEELAASAAAVQNILLGAAALGIGAFWNTGGMALKQPMKDYLGLREEDQVLGLIYMGKTETPLATGARKTPASAKVVWSKE